MLKCTAKISYIRSYMFRSAWTIFRELTLSLAKVTILWNLSVKIHRYMFSNVVVKSVSAVTKQLHYVKLISKLHRYKFFQYCGNMRCMLPQY